jgi:hypothetical protein
MDTLIRLSSAEWSPVVLLALLGVMYVTLSVKTRSATTSTRTMRIRRPGWIARHRARGGITHKRDRVGVGYTSATRSVHLSPKELAGHGALFGGPGSGKTSALQLFIEACAGRMPVVVVDPKGSPALEETVREHGGIVWTLDGKVPADLLDPRPWQVPDLLLEAEDYAADARVYRDAAHQRALWAAWSLALDGRPMDLAELRRRLDREVLSRILSLHRDRDQRVADWVQRLEHQYGGVEDSGARGLDRALGTLLDGVALRGSLKHCAHAIRLEDVVDTDGLVLFKLDAAEYPHATRKIASWVLLGMGRVVRNLVTSQPPAALLLVDEVGALGSSARHLRGLVGRAREAGLAVVLATQGPSDLEAVDPALLAQTLQDTAWQLAFRQGSPQDAERMQALFGQHYVVDESWSSDGRVTKRHVERPRVAIDEWMNSLHPGDAWLRVAPVDRGWRQERVRVALPQPPDRKQVSETAKEKSTDTKESRASMTTASSAGEQQGGRLSLVAADDQQALPPEPPDCPAELRSKMGEDVLRQVNRQEVSRRRELGACLIWTGATLGNGKYGRLYDPSLKRSDAAHLVVWRRVFGVIPAGKVVEHLCGNGLCQRPDHLRLTTRERPVRSVHGDDVAAAVWTQVVGREDPRGCWTWTGTVLTTGAGYGRAYDPRLRSTRLVHRLVYELLVGPIPDGLTIDHLCANTRCVNPSHMELTSAAENTRRARQRVRTSAEPSESPEAVQRFAVAFFAGIDRTTVQPKRLSLAELATLLSRFEVLQDKRRGRCWSPTAYVAGHTTRGNAGVESVSCLVFDCDRVPPDPKRLEGVYWLGHTTWSHTPQAPRWRVIIPLARPVPARQWTDVWRRARASLCPEADPACKDPSRAYWLPSHDGGVSAKTRRHEAPLLDPWTLPELPVEPRPKAPGLSRTPVSRDRRRSEAYMAQVLDNLASVQPGGRNAALNHAAWTLGHWVAAGALEQGEVEDALYAAAERNGLLADDGPRQTWATIRSGLSKGLIVMNS